MSDFWNGFDPETERAYQGPDGPVRVKTHPAVALLRTMEPTDAEVESGKVFDSRIARAKELAANGHIVDVQIDVWGWGAANTYRLRRMYGASSVADVSGIVRILTPPAL
jgi:hypothetical protein